MNTRMQTDAWIQHIAAVLALTVIGSVAGSVVLIMIGRPMSELLVALGMVAASGLARLLLPSPLNGG